MEKFVKGKWVIILKLLIDVYWAIIIIIKFIIVKRKWVIVVNFKFVTKSKVIINIIFNLIIIRSNTLFIFKVIITIFIIL